MAYSKQGFVNGEVLDASQLHTIEDAIIDNQTNVDNLSNTVADNQEALLTKIAELEDRLAKCSNPNLLDNWYFADPIDQRAGYVVPLDTPYYSDTGLATQAGTLTAYTSATYVDGVYGTVAVDSVTYYVDWTAAVRGYVGLGYTVDRWKGTNGSTLVTVGDEFLTLAPVEVSTNTNGYLRQHLDKPLKKGAYTFSALVRGDFGAIGVGPWYEPTGNVSMSYYQSFPENLADWQLVLVQFTVETEDILDKNAVNTVSIRTSIGNAVEIKAAKLELGSVQTLTHWDETAQEWVLNDPPPNKQQELAKCQRYYQCIRSTDATCSLGTGPCVENSDVYLPMAIQPMRAKPAVNWYNVVISNTHLSTLNVTSVSVHQYISESGFITLKLISSELTNQSIYRVGLAKGGYLILDANL